ncbi:MAG: Hpt domain-containing protein [Oscillospiraceae bacterium]|nr:Hpt domain-containing protein [Oscillospiraceae bacterium]
MNSFMEKLTSIPEINVKKALNAMGGMTELYERVVLLTARTMPEHIERLNRQMAEKHPDYVVSVHGVKGALNSIGAYDLGQTAYELEKKSKSGDFESCRELHNTFIQEMIVLARHMQGLQEEQKEKTEGCRAQLSAALKDIAAALHEYDRPGAMDYLSVLCGQSFGTAEDNALEKIKDHAERFEYEEALAWMDKLQNLLKQP